MNQFVHQRVEHLDRIAQRRRDENLVARVFAARGAPALPDVPAAQPGAGKAARDLALGDDMVLGSEQRAQRLDASAQPGFTQAVQGNGRVWVRHEGQVWPPWGSQHEPATL